MKTKKIPMRTCVITKEKLPKKELIRIVRTPDADVVIDLVGKTNGRGAYIKKDITVLEKIKKTNILSKHLECDIPNEIYDELENIIDNEN